MSYEWYLMALVSTLGGANAGEHTVCVHPVPARPLRSGAGLVDNLVELRPAVAANCARVGMVRRPRPYGLALPVFAR
jgi:hypothetical protein